MAIILEKSQRDGVYKFLLYDLSNVSEIHIALKRGEIEEARVLRQRLEEDLRLLDQIGWEKDSDQAAFGITLPSDEIRSIFTHLREEAIKVINDAMTEFANQMLTEAYAVTETCSVVLLELPGGTRHLRSQSE